jgi:hypothetical protein
MMELIIVQDLDEQLAPLIYTVHAINYYSCLAHSNCYENVEAYLHLSVKQSELVSFSACVHLQIYREGIYLQMIMMIGRCSVKLCILEKLEIHCR